MVADGYLDEEAWAHAEQEYHEWLSTTAQSQMLYLRAAKVRRGLGISPPLTRRATKGTQSVPLRRALCSPYGVKGWHLQVDTRKGALMPLPRPISQRTGR